MGGANKITPRRRWAMYICDHIQTKLPFGPDDPQGGHDYFCPGLSFRAGFIMPQRLLLYAVEFMDSPNINLYLFIDINFNISSDLCNGWLFGLAQEIEYYTKLSVNNKSETDASN